MLRKNPIVESILIPITFGALGISLLVDSKRHFDNEKLFSGLMSAFSGVLYVLLSCMIAYSGV